MKTKPKASRFDSLFESAKFALPILEKRITGPARDLARQHIGKLGLDFAWLLQYGHPQDLRDMADALGQWREANRPADRLQAIDSILVELPRLFPLRPKRADRLVRYRTREIAVRDVLENLQLRGFGRASQTGSKFRGAPPRLVFRWTIPPDAQNPPKGIATKGSKKAASCLNTVYVMPRSFAACL